MNSKFCIMVVSVVAAVTILGVKWMSLAVKRPEPIITIDTLYLSHHDTTTVISRARDTIRVIVKEVGPLTEQMVARIICGDLTYGDKRDRFGFNAVGMVFCPKEMPHE